MALNVRTAPPARAMSVGQRLVLGLLPSLLAVALVVGLAYWGEYGRTAPVAVVGGAAVLAVASLVATWLNARDLTRRIARLAATVTAVRRLVGADGSTGRDELDRVEEVIARLRAAVATAEEARAAAERAVATELRARGALVEATTRETLARLDEMRLPLHILLESRFGALNENQEELLAAAREAGDALDASLRRLRLLAEADQGTLPVQRALVSLNDVVRAVEPQIRALAERQGRTVIVELEPGLPRAWVDRAKLAEALVLLARIALRPNGGEVLRVGTTREGAHGDPDASGPGRSAGAVVLAPVPAPAPSEVAGGALAASATALDEALAVRLLEAQGARVARIADGLRVEVAGG